MNRLIVLSIPLLNLAIPGSAGSSARAAGPGAGESGNPWQASLAAEKRGRYEEARQQAAGHARSGGDRFMAMIRTAWLHLQEGDHGQAERFYTEALSGAAWSAWNLGRKSEAKQGFLQLLALDPDYPHAQEGVGLCSR